MKRILVVLPFVFLTATAPGQIAVVTRNVNLRAGPSRSAVLKEKLYPADEVMLFDTTQTNGYYEVRAADGEDGWVWSRNVRITDVVVDSTPPGQPETVFHSCQPEGTAQQAHRQESNRRKNRVTHPQASEIAQGATIAAILQNSNDRTRWSEDSGASIVAFVVDVKKGSNETVNCGDTALAFIDTHIDVVQNPNDTRKRVRMIVEVTPRWRAFVGQENLDWTTPTLRQTLLGHWVRFTGWLFWDFEHAHNAENTHAGDAANWRATAWEIHPVTEIKVCPGSPQNCD